MEEKDIAILEKSTIEVHETSAESAKAHSVLAQPKPQSQIKTKNVFSSTTFETEKPEKHEIEEKKDVQSSSIIEKPNYDFIENLSPEEEQKIYKIEKEEAKDKPRHAPKRLRALILGLVLSVCSIWGIYNIVTITNLQAEIEAANELYQLNLANYLSKLGSLDSASNYNELFETFPEAHNPPASVEKSSNWFDRICDFIAGLFGG